MKRALTTLRTAAVMATLLGATSAHAALLGTASDSVGFTPTELDGTLVIPAFGGPGTVTSIDIKISGEVDSTISLTNNGSVNQNVSAASNSGFFFSASELGLPAAPQINLSASTGVVSLASNETQIFDVDDMDMFSFSVNSGLAALLDGFAVDVETLTGLSTQGGGGNLASSQDTQAFAEIAVTYNGDEPTTDVPAPATFLLLGMGLCGLGFVGRRYAKA